MKRKGQIAAGILAAVLLGALLINTGLLSEQPDRDVSGELEGKQVDVILFMGQSNMSGAGGDASRAPEVPDGRGYEYRAVTQPDALVRLRELLGKEEHREGLLDDRELLERKGTLASAFVNAYYEETGTPVVAIAASRGSSSMASWLDRLAGDALDRLSACRDLLDERGIPVRHCFMVWLQGEADANKRTPAEEYMADLSALVDQMEEGGVEGCFLIQIGNDALQPGHHEEIQEAQLRACEEDERIHLASVLPASLDAELDELGVHFNQDALNLIGEDAGCRAGLFVCGLEQADPEGAKHEE